MVGGVQPAGLTGVDNGDRLAGGNPVLGVESRPVIFEAGRLDEVRKRACVPDGVLVEDAVEEAMPP